MHGLSAVYTRHRADICVVVKVFCPGRRWSDEKETLFRGERDAGLYAMLDRHSMLHKL